MKTYFYIFLWCFVWACSSKEEAHSPQEEQKNEAHTHKEEISLSLAQVKTAEIEMGSLQIRPIGDAILTTGKLHLLPQNMALVNALIGGNIKKINVHEGDFVQKGQTLGTLQHPDFVDIQQDYLSGKANLVMLKADLERQQSLRQENANAEKQLQKAQADYQTAWVRQNALKQKLQLLNIPAEALTPDNISSEIAVTAPISGFVSKIFVNMGSFAGSNQALFELQNMEHLHVELQVYEKDISKVAKNQKVSIKAINQPHAKTYWANVYAIGKSIDEQSKVVSVHAELAEHDSPLLVGTPVEAIIHTQEADVLAVPEEAIIEKAGKKFIFIQKESTQDSIHFQAMEIQTGSHENGFWEIQNAEKLPKDAKIVLKGAFYIEAAQEGSEEEGGHSH